MAIVAVLSAGGIASFAAGWRAPQMSELSPSDIVALRFAETWEEPEGPARVEPADAEEAAVEAYERLVMFSPQPLFPQPIRPSVALAAVPAIQPTPAAKPPIEAPIQAQPVKAESAPDVKAAKPETVRAKPAAAIARQTPRSPNVLNDAQIASIKKRLNLSPDQEYMWPSVEAALRKLVYVKAPTGARQASHTIDPNSVELQSLKSAAVPLVMSFDDTQKRELRTLVQVMGLEKLASQF
jgi:hypothetical protein